MSELPSEAAIPDCLQHVCHNRNCGLGQMKEAAN
jgi:hypothetical protein